MSFWQKVFYAFPVIVTAFLAGLYAIKLHDMPTSGFGILIDAVLQSHFTIFEVFYNIEYFLRATLSGEQHKEDIEEHILVIQFLFAGVSVMLLVLGTYPFWFEGTHAEFWRESEEGALLGYFVIFCILSPWLLFPFALLFNGS